MVKRSVLISYSFGKKQKFILHTPSTFPRKKRPPTVFNRIEVEVAKRAAAGQNVIALHVGDAYLPLPSQLLEPVPDEDRLYGTGLNRYGDAFGDEPLREALLAKVKSHNNLPPTGIDCIQVTGGATGALHTGFSRLLDNGADVLTLSPYWSILRVVAEHSQVELVEVPFFDRLADNPSFDPAEALEKYLTGKTGGIYINTPSNPTGIVLSGDVLEKIGSFARKYDLWIFSDEAYEDYIYDDSKHISIGSLPGMFERTLTIHSFSKCFGASGMRIGYVTAPAPVIAELHRGVVGSHYQVDRYAMRMAWRGMRKFDEIVSVFKPGYAAIWRWVRDNLKCDMLPCTSGFYFFVKLGSGFEGMSSEEKVSRMLDTGVVLSPGEYFGDDYGDWARLCFTVVRPDDVKTGVQRFNELITL